MNRYIKNWFDRLDLAKHDLAWHKNDIAEEVEELKEAKGIIHHWSELSDICFAYNRSVWAGYKNITLPINKGQYIIGLFYMFPKYNLRWKFFRDLGDKLGVKIREVRNPSRLHKLEKIAAGHGVDKQKFLLEAKKLLKRRILLK